MAGVCRDFAPGLNVSTIGAVRGLRRVVFEAMGVRHQLNPYTGMAAPLIALAPLDPRKAITSAIC